MVGCVVVVLLAAIAVYVFWPAEPTQIAELKDTEQIQKPAEHRSGTAAKLQQPRVKTSAAQTGFRSSKAADYRRLSPLARKAYRRLASRNQSGHLSATSLIS